MNNYDFLDMTCTVTHLKRFNEGGSTYNLIETVGVLYPNWDCNKWDIVLSYKGNNKHFELYIGTDLGEPNLYDILVYILNNDYVSMNITRPKFIDEKGLGKYKEFFTKHHDSYDVIEESLLSGIWTSGLRLNGFLYKLLGKEEYNLLKEFMKSC